MLLPITSLFAAIMVIFFVAMSFYVIYTRAKTEVLTGDDDNIRLIVAMRRHGNLAEYLPFSLLIMALGELAGLSAGWLTVAGLLLLGGRLVHPFGIAADGGNFTARVAGVTATFAAMLIPAIFILATQFT